VLRLMTQRYIEHVHVNELVRVWPESPTTVQQSGAQNAPIRTANILIGIQPTSAQIGGSEHVGYAKWATVRSRFTDRG
jgi:hypothetical protein